MKISYLQFNGELSTYIQNLSQKKNIHVIIPNEFQCEIDVAITKFKNYIAHFKYKAIAELAHILIQHNSNPNFAIQYIQSIIDNVETKNYNHYNDIIAQIIQKSSYQAQYNYLLNTFINNIKTDNLLVIGFHENHPLIQSIAKQDLTQCETIFINPNSQHNNISINRNILLEKPERWYKLQYPEINGINIIDCDTIEGETQNLLSLIKKWNNAEIIIDSPQLLRRLEILLDDISYYKPVTLDFGVIFLLQIIEEDVNPSFFATPHTKPHINRDQFFHLRGAIFNKIDQDSSWVEAHLKFMQEISTIKLSTVAQTFINNITQYVKDIYFKSLNEYQQIVNLLAHNITYKKFGKIKCTTSNDISTGGSTAIISTRNWNNEASFYHLLNVDSIFIVHNKNEKEPEWLTKLRILLHPKFQISYTNKNFNKIKLSQPKASPPASARPQVLSATMVEMLIKNPYAFYLRYILKLKPEMTIEMNFGNFIHKVLAQYNNEDNYELLLQYAQNELKQYQDNPEAQALWLPKFTKIAQLFIEQHKKRNVKNFYNEKLLNFELLGYTIAVTCDRLEILEDDTIAIIEYKTGSLPTLHNISSGLSPQLLLQGIATQKFFGKKIMELTYWQLQPHKITVKTIPNPQEHIDKFWVDLTNILTNYKVQEFYGTDDYPQYHHMSRIKEIFF